MDYQTVTLATAFLGSAISGIWDLKTTEIPDQIPYIMIAVALITYGIQSYMESNYQLIANSIIVGLLALGFGFLMYYFGQWGGGDAKLLSAIGFLLPTAPSGFTNLFFPFPLSFLFNLFLVGAAYMLVYALIIAAFNRKIIDKFAADVKSSTNVLFLGSVAIFTVFIILNYFIAKVFSSSINTEFLVIDSIFPLSATIVIFLVWKFAKAVEEIGFKKKIPMGKLRVGDVPLDSKLWEGITEKELKKIKASGKKVIWIKEGVRFAPSFILALIFTLVAGDGILLFFKLVV